MNNEDHVELRGLVDECTRHVESLKFLGQEFTGVSELIVVHLLGAALDKDTRRLWESEVKNCDLPKYDKMLQFLKAQCFVLERCEDLNQKQPTVQPKPVVKSTQKSYAMSTSKFEITSEDRCDICGNGHKNHACPVFKELPMPQKLVKVREHNLCFNCLKRGHPSKKCTSPGTCSKCKLRHHSLLHSEGSPRPERKVISQVPPEQAPEVQPEEAAQLTTASCHNVTPTQQVLLLTAVVDIMDRNNKAHPCRVLLDSASQANLISKSMVESLGLKQFPSNVSVAGIDNTKTHASTGSVVQLRSRYSSFSANVKCLVTERVTADLPTSAVNVRNWELPPGVQLADPSFHQPGKVDLLLGNQLFLKLLLPGEVQLSEHLPMLRETQLGWVGGVCDEEEETAAVVHSHMAILENLNLEAGEAKIIAENLKVDKAVFASDGIPQAFKESQLIQLCKTGGFELHKGSSDSPEAEREELVSVGGTEVNEVIKALDLLWNPTADKQPFPPLPSVRAGRPETSQVFSLGASFSSFVDSNLDLKMIREPRRVVATNAAADELHKYADASKHTYGAELNLKLVPKTVNTIVRSELLAARFSHMLVKNVLVSSRELRCIYAAKVASRRLEIITYTNLDLGNIVRVIDLRTRRKVLKRPILYNAASGGEDVRAESCQPEENFTSEQCPTPRLLRSTTKLATARR
ncbi:uncharacterized protein LOC120430829 [Culex pipiens pallens]|uniref:uncharacterized protein LOC120430829 n=1 Tax=Culex pipiens pallens TaxID=42434 RepID=UPI001954B129|nr:uncharacterized protein LOC120430829 [Culex pipiens pallens]